jgi:hypothetical protein
MYVGMGKQNITPPRGKIYYPNPTQNCSTSKYTEWFAIIEVKANLRKQPPVPQCAIDSATGLGATRYGVRIPAEVEDFYILQNV